jgi:hypothetical protein
VGAIALEARAQGEKLSEFHGDCLTPVWMHLFGYPDKVLVGLGIEPDRALAQEITVRCRKCANCLKHRARLWTARATAEVAVSHRTWFSTLTLAPDHALRIRYAALKAISAPNDRNSNEAELFKAMADQVSDDLTKWLKRVRKNSGARLRYLLVCESHKSGVPHWHALIHECSEVPVTKRQLDEAWRLGFAKFKLVDGDALPARYVCKYLAKSALTRVRASQKYGDVKERLTERLSDAAALMRGRTRPTVQREGGK